MGGVDKCDSCRRDADRRTVVLFGDTDALLYNVDTDVTGSDVVIPATVEQDGNSYTVNEMRAALLKTPPQSSR